VIPSGTFFGLDSLPKTASTVAPILYRASPIDPALRSPASSDSASRDLASYSTSLPADGRKTPQLPSASEFAHSFGNPDSTPPSTTLPPLDSRQENLGLPRSNSGTTSLPGLSALASVAIAPTSDLRYVRNPRPGMQRLCIHFHPSPGCRALPVLVPDKSGTRHQATLGNIQLFSH
jgi:hypothetical protein